MSDDLAVCCKRTPRQSTSSMQTSLTDTSRGPHYHFHHPPLSMSLRKLFSVDFHYLGTSTLLRADRDTAAGAAFTTTMSMYVSVTERRVVRWQRRRV